MNAETLNSSASCSIIDLKARNAVSQKAKLKVPQLPLSSRNDCRREEFSLIKKLYYNPFNELACYKEFKQHEKNQKQLKKQKVNEKQDVFTKRTNSANEILPKSLILQNFQEEISPQEVNQNKQLNFFTERINRQNSLQGYQHLNNEKSSKQYIESRKSSLFMEDMKIFQDPKLETQNNQMASSTQPTQNADIQKKIITQNNQNETKRPSVNHLLNNFVGDQQDQKNQFDAQKVQKQLRVQKPKALSFADDIYKRQEQKKEEEIEQIKKRASQETLAYKEIKEINQILKKQRCQTTRFLNRTKKKTEQIELNLQQDVEIELDTKVYQEKQIIKYIIREQLNPQRPQEEIQKMFEETLRSNQIKNFLDKLKIEKASFVANKIISKIKTFQGKNFLKNQYFSELEKDPKSLAKPLSVLIEYGKAHAEAEQKLKIQTKQLSLKDDLKIDFFKQFNNQQIKRDKADNIYDFRSKAMTITLNKHQNTQENKSNPSKFYNSEQLNDEQQSHQNTQSIKFQRDSPQAQDISEDFANNNHQRVQIEQISNILNQKQEQYQNDQTPMKKIIIKRDSKRKPLLNGGIEYEYINELGFKIRVQQPPKKKEYKEVQIQKFQKSEDIFFKNLFEKSKKIANEVEVTNRITDHTHKKQMKNYHK